ncbi:plasma membrane localization protein [Polyrhizophydium stewartii]|uniref:Plasma membrane localization protein n=1 Tax=Polyrhizophydium stewartii TaxID=2732419 RepID=A0ABR4MYK4_9FUNG
MAAPCGGVCSKHVSLINNVYPKEPGEEGPRGSALSLVIFYATTKPQKLPKIGAYLEKRVKADTRKSRFGYIRVTLQILHSLLSECRQNSNLISKNILRIILDVLHSPDPDLVMQATSIFILFSSHHNHQNVIDSEFAAIYSQLIEKFCNEAAYETSDATLQHKTRLSGLKALEAVCGSDSFVLSPNLVPYSKKIIPAVLANMGPSKPRPESTELATPSMYTKRRSITDHLITDDELKHSAKVCISGLFGQANVTNLKEFLLSTSKFLDEKSLWSSSVYTLEVVRAVTHVVQSQYHYVILSLMLERLEFETKPEIKTTVIRVLTFLISDGEGISGLTIPELLETFARHLRSSVEKPATDDQMQLHAHARLQQALVEAIGSLAFHLAYPNQINDILSFLVNRLIAEHGSVEASILLLRALDQVMIVYTRRFTSSETKRLSIIPANISFELVTPTLVLMSHPSADARLPYFPFLYKALGLAVPARDDRDSHGLVALHSSLWRVLYDSSLNPSHNPADFVIVGMLATRMLQFMPVEDLFVSVPIFMRLQDHVIEGRVASPEQQRAIGSLVVEYFIHVAMFLSNSELLAYTQSVKQTRLDGHEWSPGFELTCEAIDTLHTRTFSETEASAARECQPITSFLDRVNVADCLARDSRLGEFEEANSRLVADTLLWESSMPTTPLRPNAPDLSRLSVPDSMPHGFIGRRASQRRSPSPSNIKQAASTRSASEQPYTTVRVEDLRDALASDAKAPAIPGKILDTSNIDLDLLSRETTGQSDENVTNLLQTIASTFGKSGQAGKIKIRAAEAVELDWLTARSRELSREAQASPGLTRTRSISQQRIRSSESSSSLRGVKLREPDMLGLEATQ